MLAGPFRFICFFNQYLDAFSGLFVLVGDCVKRGVAQINVIVSVPTLVLSTLARVARIVSWTRIGDFHDNAGVFSTVAFALGVMTPHLQMFPTHARFTLRTLTCAHIPTEAIITVTS